MARTRTRTTKSATFLSCLGQLYTHCGVIPTSRTRRSRLAAALPLFSCDSDGSDNDDDSRNEGWISARTSTANEAGVEERAAKADAGPDVYEVAWHEMPWGVARAHSRNAASRTTGLRE